MDDHILDAPHYHVACVHPGALIGTAKPHRPQPRCLLCRGALAENKPPGEILATHLRQSTACLNNYVARKDLVGNGDGTFVVVASLHAFRTPSDWWVVQGVAPNGEFHELAKCRSKKDADETLRMFLVEPQLTEVTK